MPGKIKYLGQIMQLQTARLQLNLLEQDDVPAVYDMEVALGKEQMTIVKTYDQLTKAVDRWSSHFEQDGLGVYGATQKDTGKFIGTGGLQHAGVNFYYAGEPEVCFLRIVPDEKNKGYGKEIFERMVDLAMDQLQLPQVWGCTPNPISDRLFNRAAFTRQADFYYNEQFSAVHVYKLTQEEFLSNKAKNPPILAYNIK